MIYRCVLHILLLKKNGNTGTKKLLTKGEVERCARIEHKSWIGGELVELWLGLIRLGAAVSEVWCGRVSLAVCAGLVSRYRRVG